MTGEPGIMAYAKHGKNKLSRYAHTRSFSRLAGSRAMPASGRVRTDFTGPRLLFGAAVLLILLIGLLSMAR